MPEISFRMERQKAGNWCWAAVAVSVARYFNRSSTWTQCKVVTQVLRHADRRRPLPDCCKRPTPTQCDQAWRLEEALRQVGRRRTQWQAGHLSFTEIQDSIRAGKPVGVRIAWDDRLGHFVVVSGCHINRQGVKQVDVEDPATGEALVDYRDLVYRYRGSGRWSHTYVV